MKTSSLLCVCAFRIDAAFIDSFLLHFLFMLFIVRLEICVFLDQNIQNAKIQRAPPGGGVNKAMRARAEEEQVCAFDLIKTVKS